jgi:hypothetical protein
LPQWLEPAPEPETVTLYGEVLEQRDTETVFRVHYGDDDNTVAEFTIPNEQFQNPAFADTTSTQDFITLTLAYAVEAGIVAAPEAEAPIHDCATCKHGHDGEEQLCMLDTALPPCVDFSAWEAQPDSVSDENGDRACVSCTHCDAGDDDNACEDCGNDLANFTPLAAPMQGQGASMGVAQ